MGFLDRFKRKTQAPGSVKAPEPVAEPQREAPPRQAAGPSFEWQGEAFPIPSGWVDLSLEDWFLKLEQTRDRLMHADEEDLKAMSDEDGEPLAAEEVLLCKLGFQSGHHWECFRSWGVSSWARKTGGDPGALLASFGLKPLDWSNVSPRSPRSTGSRGLTRAHGLTRA